MANTNTIYSDEAILVALLSKDFSGIGNEYENDELETIRRNAFSGATLNRVALPNLKTIPSGCFKNAKINTLDLNFDEITEVGREAFTSGGLSSRTSLSLPKCTKIGDGAFNINSSLSSISLPLFNGDLTADSLYAGSETGMFREDTALTGAGLNLPELKTISAVMFRSCSSLDAPVFPKVTTMASGSFYGCSKLKKITFSGEVKTVTGSPFTSCPNLECVIFSGVTAVPTATGNIFNSSGIATGKGYVYVPAALLDAFQSANYWSTYRDVMRAIEDYPSVIGN